MSTTELLENSVDEQVDEEWLLRSVVDFDFRNEFSSIDFSTLPASVLPQDMSFAEIVKNANQAACVETCISGFTIVCDGRSYECRSTCITGWTMRCDGTSL
ncbi:cinnamycin family lantibiotic [Planktothrix sp. FACHB-1365]|uniref:cinnamycin family lantibiotic n=1 Tax=Planktothrix sp. FACHB-1365 TaxID=2692855 RepID=UPI001686088A|nr:cinnamycin family lantibiotic [Planktothrix sp. FACHB-1365]MBD2484027.1 cinnamycin family lantibiotic [Planktothrix sp. FACHB-1365]